MMNNRTAAMRLRRRASQYPTSPTIRHPNNAPATTTAVGSGSGAIKPRLGLRLSRILGMALRAFAAIKDATPAQAFLIRKAA